MQVGRWRSDAVVRAIVAGVIAAGAIGLSWRTALANADETKSLVRVDASTDKAIARLKQALRTWDVAGRADQGRSLDLIVDQHQRRRLTIHGVPFEVIIEDVAAAKALSRASYHSFPQMEIDLAAMASNYPAITDLTSIGLSWEGRDIWCLEITDNPGVDEGEPGVVFMALHHAREWPGLSVAMDIADRLTRYYATDFQIQNLVNSRRIWVIPCINADGYVWDHDQGHDWRKNRHPYALGIGVDLNRNYAGSGDGTAIGAWGSIGDGSQSHHSGQSTYLGPAPFSEPETQAIRNFFNGRDVTISLSYHTSGELVIWPWDYTLGATTEDNGLLVSFGQGLAGQITGQNGSSTYSPGQGASLYPTTGSSDDWIYGHRYYRQGLNTLAYTIELCTTYHPSASALQQVLDENWDGARYALQQAASIESLLTPVVLPPLLTAPALDGDGDFTLPWQQQNPDAGADLYAVDELVGLSRLIDGAETGLGKWVNQQFSTSSARQHSGLWSFKSPAGDQRIAAMTTPDPLPVAAGDQLTFWTWYDIETDWDMAFVEVSADGRYFDVLDMFTGNSGGWVQKTYSLDAYAGGSVYLRFRYTTDSAVTEEGFYVDDIYPVASWSTITTLSSSIATTSYPITGRVDGDYYYRVKGSNPARGFGDFGPLVRTQVNTQLADADGDGDRDLEDFAGFQACYGGDGQPVPPGCPAAVFDLDADTDVDLTDLDIFEQCLGGPQAPLPPACPF
ncbi:MAG: hypothetical protein GY778_23915 [bacterium]|nr:hypothetical protein [bacterium]